MVRRPLLVALSILLVTSCSGDDADGPAATLDSSAEESSTTTSTTEPERTVEEEVEAAYLHAWDVYSEAMGAADPSRLDEIFADRALEIVVADVAKLASAGHRGRMSVEHDYEITVDGDTATVLDAYLNHSVLLDGETGQPIEDDPNDVLSYTYTLQLNEESWMVVAITRPSH